MSQILKTGAVFDSTEVYNLKDNLTVRKHTLHPQFNKCHAFGSATGMAESCGFTKTGRSNG